MGNYEHRKATDRIRFTDASGNPVADSDVRVKLVKHKFLFGSGANDFLPPEELTEEERANIPLTAEQQAVANDINHKWLDMFNYGTMHFYWGMYEPVEGETRYE